MGKDKKMWEKEKAASIKLQAALLAVRYSLFAIIHTIIELHQIVRNIDY
jgi:hypothetical protein